MCRLLISADFVRRHRNLLDMELIDTILETQKTISIISKMLKVHLKYTLRHFALKYKLWLLSIK
jgi:hypothetical protein